MSTALSKYPGDSVSRLASTFTLERYGPRILVQHINDGENVMVTFVETSVRMHLNNINLSQVIVSPNYDASSQKIFSCWSVQLLESPLLSTDDVFIGSHVSYKIIDWLMHNNTRDEITLRFISFFQPFLSFMSFVLPFFYRLCHLYCRSLLFILSFVLPFFIVYIVHNAVLCCSLPFILPFFIIFYSFVYHFFLSFNSHSLSFGTDRLNSRNHS